MRRLSCTVCNGSLLVDAKGEFANCEYCGAKYDKRAIKQIIEGIQGYDELVKNAEIFLDLKEFHEAELIFIEITGKYPDKARGWWGLFASMTEGLTTYRENERLKVYYDRAMKFASAEEKERIASLHEDYIARKNEYNQKQEEKQEEIKMLGAERRDLEGTRHDLERKFKDSPFKVGCLFGVLLFLAGFAALAAFSGVMEPFVLSMCVICAILFAIIVTLVRRPQHKREIERMNDQIQEIGNKIMELNKESHDLKDSISKWK